MATKATWEMTGEELAKVVAAQYGYRGDFGGWIRDAAGKAVAHGWAGFAKHLQTNGFIRVGRGVNWTRIEWAGGPAGSGQRASTRLARARYA